MKIIQGLEFGNTIPIYLLSFLTIPGTSQSDVLDTS